MKSRSILFTAPFEVALGEVDIPEPVGSEVLVKARYTSVSPGTELRCLSGVQDGFESWPCVPGYSHTGDVVDAGPESTVPIGTRVFSYGSEKVSISRLWGGHCEFAVRTSSTLHVIPDAVAYEEAVFGHLAGIAYHGLRLSRPLPHDKIAVIGLGAIGQFSARLHALSGARTVGFDTNPLRADLLRRAGVEAHIVSRDLEDCVKAVFPEGADVVVDATGVPNVFVKAMECGRFPPWGEGSGPGTRYLVQGSYPAAFSIPYQRAFEREAHLLFPRDCVPSDIRRCLELMAREKLPARDLAARVEKPGKAPEIYGELQKPGCGMVTCLFDWAG